MWRFEQRRIQRKTLRAARANRVFGTDEKRIRTKNTVMGKSKGGFASVLIQDRRLCADVLFVRAQSAIRADGPPSAQVLAMQSWNCYFFLTARFFLADFVLLAELACFTWITRRWPAASRPISFHLRRSSALTL